MTESARREFGERLRAAGCSHGAAAAMRLGVTDGRELRALLDGEQTRAALRATAAEAYGIELSEGDSEALALQRHRANERRFSMMPESHLDDLRRAHTPSPEVVSEKVTLTGADGAPLEQERVERLPDGSTLTITRGAHGQILRAEVEEPS